MNATSRVASPTARRDGCQCRGAGAHPRTARSTRPSVPSHRLNGAPSARHASRRRASTSRAGRPAPRRCARLTAMRVAVMLRPRRVEPLDVLPELGVIGRVDRGDLVALTSQLEHVVVHLRGGRHQRLDHRLRTIEAIVVGAHEVAGSRTCCTLHHTLLECRDESPVDPRHRPVGGSRCDGIVAERPPAGAAPGNGAAHSVWRR